jgi:hypothetical protein
MSLDLAVANEAGITTPCRFSRHVFNIPASL